MCLAWSSHSQDSLDLQLVIPQADSLLPQLKWLQKLDSVTDLTNYLTNPLDSVNLNSQLTPGINRKVDSLTHLPEFYTAKLDSLIQTKSALIQEKINHLQTQATSKFTGLDSLHSMAPDSLLGNSFSNLGLDLDQYSQEMKGIDELMDRYTAKIKDQEELAWVEHYRGQLDQLDQVVQDYQGKALELEEIQQLQGYSQQLQQLSQESQGYFQQVNQAVSGGLTEDSQLMRSLQEKLGQREEFQQLQAHITEFEEVEGLGEEAAKYQDPEYLRQKALEQAKKLGDNNLTQHTEKLEVAQKKLSDLKKKYSAVQSSQDLSTAVKRNSLQQEPFSERFLIGLGLQVNQDPTSADISPQIAYRLNRKYRIGLGASYRVILSFDQFNNEDQVYGYRAFLEREAYKGFFLHLEYENLSVTPDSVNLTDHAHRRWNSGGLVGVGKQYKFIKGIQGQVMVLYDLLYDKGITPYDKRLMVRFGFWL